MRISDYVIFSDRQLIVMHKPPGMPTQEDASGDASLHRITQAYCKHDVFVVHRLDRPCSGVVVFAKTPAAASHISQQFRERTIRKQYLAVVEKGLEPREGELRNFLTEGAHGNMTVTADDDKGAVEAVLRYRTIGEIDNYLLLSIDLESGRKHQIRAQLAAAGFPVKGDDRYGFKRGNPGRHIHLHAQQIELLHPTKGERMTFTCLPAAEPVWDAFGLEH